MTVPTNEYLPAGLPLLSDYTLFRTVLDYEHQLEDLERQSVRDRLEQRRRIRAALEAISREMRERGLRETYARREFA